MATWLFKGNPSVFDIDAYLRTTNPITWTVGGPVEALDRIAAGDRVFMFRSGDGVVAVGRATGGPQPYGDQGPRVRALWRRPSPKPNDPCIPVAIDEVRLGDGMLRVADLRRHPILAGPSVLKLASGTTFAVTEDEDRALMELWEANAR